MTQKTGGFTLIELLVALILAAIVITPLLGFMINIMDTDRKEQAKAASEQEIQTAIDYIAQDLEQAVYIYDADGLDKTSTDSPPGIKDQIPPLASAPGCESESTTPTCTPVLVFWKREFKQAIIPVFGSTTAKNDTFIYSLVAYYLIKGKNADESWSDAARIGRFQIQNGVRDPANLTKTDGSFNYIEEPSKGFQLFNLSLTGITLKDRMNRWQKNNEDYTDKTFTLVDFIDQSLNGIAANCPANTQVPSILAGGFYACVDSSRTSAQIYIRGNALARISQDAPCDSQSTYCPTASVQIKGRGLLGAD